MDTRAEGSSMFTNAQNFDTQGGLFNSAARDLHVHYYSHTDRGDDSQHQSQTAGMPPPIPPGGTSIWSWIPFLGGWFRAQTFETEVINIVEAEYASLVSGAVVYQPLVVTFLAKPHRFDDT
jgi:hypothetical protein